MARRKNKEHKIPTTKEEKLNLAKQIANESNRKYGEVVVQLAKDLPVKERPKFGIEEIDKFTGGVVSGNYVIIYGSPNVGKSTLIQNLIGNAQTNGKVCAYVDLEHKFDPQWATKNGVDIDELIYIGNLDTAEQSMDTVNTFAKNRAIDLIIVDSIQAFSPRGEQQTKGGAEKSIEDDEMALLARKVGKFLRVTTAKVSKAKIAMVLIGQIRTQGIGSFHTFSGLSGGNALKHISIFTIFMRQGEKKNAPYVYEVNPIGEKEKTYIGFECVLKIEKKQITDDGAKELAELRIPFYFSTGFKKENSPLPKKLIVIDESKIRENLKQNQKELIEGSKRKRGRPRKTEIKKEQ